MKNFLAFITCLYSLSISAQTHKKIVPAKPAQAPVEYALLKGHIANYTNNMIDYFDQDYFGGFTKTIKVNSDGSFATKIKRDQLYTEIELLAGDESIPLIFMNRDTIDISWDQQNIQKTIKIHTTIPALANELMDYITLDRIHRQKIYDAHQNIYDAKLSDSAKFSIVNNVYNQDIEAIAAKPVNDASAKQAIDIYFDCANLLRDGGLLSKYQLYLKNKPNDGRLANLVTDTRYPLYKQENDWFYKISPSYRNFIFDYVRFNTSLNSTAYSGDPVKNPNATLPFAPALKDYHLAMATFGITEMRDWFVTRSLFFDFEDYSFDDAVSIYKDYITKIKTPYYADTLKQYFSRIQKLKPGGPAPVFSLKDENGKTVALSDFKGKNVYIDFWGVYCGPCIYDITNEVPKLHEKYKDKNVVFINICVDADTQLWKENLKKLNLHGVNLLAEGWVKNPVCKVYNINAIPHYYLLNTEGRIVDNNSKKPGFGIEDDIDKLLK